jgi:histidyl-tRNA synthetase
VFGSVGGGGRYDGLVSRFRAEPVPATGFSIGVSRLSTALKLTGNLPEAEPVGPVVVLVLDRISEAMADYQQIVSQLRAQNIRAEMYLGASGMNAQMKYADRRNAPAVVIVGGNERAAGEVTIKDLAKGAEASKDIADNAAWKSERPGQVTVKRGEMLDRIKEVPAIARQLSEAGGSK